MLGKRETTVQEDIEDCLVKLYVEELTISAATCRVLPPQLDKGAVLLFAGL